MEIPILSHGGGAVFTGEAVIAGLVTATSACRAGFSDDAIRPLGRGESDAYGLYVTAVPARVLAAITSARALLLPIGAGAGGSRYWPGCHMRYAVLHSYVTSFGVGGGVLPKAGARLNLMACLGLR